MPKVKRTFSRSSHHDRFACKVVRKMYHFAYEAVLDVPTVLMLRNTIQRIRLFTSSGSSVYRKEQSIIIAVIMWDNDGDDF